MDHIHHVGFGELTYKAAEDGTMTVYGKATGPDLDLDQQICDPEWLKTAMPQWLATGANVREMHQSIAAGVGLEIAADGDDWSLKAEVVDESTMRKVEKKVLKGFSIGIKGARIVKDEKAKGGRIVAGQIVEISLVDRPANPTCLAEIAKVYGGGELEIAKGLEPLIPDTQQNVGNMPEVQQEVIHSSHPGAKDADDVYPAEEMCAACHGTGKTVDTQETCEMCGGEGKHPASMVTPNDFESLAPEIAKKEVVADIEKVAADLVKINENHDEKGRFASGGEGGSLHTDAHEASRNATVDSLNHYAQGAGAGDPKASEDPSSTGAVAGYREVQDHIKAGGSRDELEQKATEAKAYSHELGQAMLDRATFSSAESNTVSFAHAYARGLSSGAAAWDTSAKLGYTGDTAPKTARVEIAKAIEADLAKRQFTQGERTVAAAAGHATPSGSFPINNVEDLKNAIRSQGRAKDRDQVIGHIKTRAAALNRLDLIPDAWKTDSTEKMEHNADDLAAVRQSIINLMKAELDEMASGVEDETSDVGNLFRALDLFMCWWQNEANEEETTSPYMNESQGQDTMAYIGLGVEADLIKRATSEEATEEVREELRVELRKALGVDTEIAIHKAEIEAQKKDVETLKSVLEEVRSMATPGGPSLRATQAQASKSADADRLEMEASYFRRMAEAVDNPSLKNGYLAKALEAEADYKKLIRN